jgi:hypothetical protein
MKKLLRIQAKFLMTDAAEENDKEHTGYKKTNSSGVHVLKPS